MRHESFKQYSNLIDAVSGPCTYYCVVSPGFSLLMTLRYVPPSLLFTDKKFDAQDMWGRLSLILT